MIEILKIVKRLKVISKNISKISEDKLIEQIDSVINKIFNESLSDVSSQELRKLLIDIWEIANS